MRECPHSPPTGLSGTAKARMSDDDSQHTVESMELVDGQIHMAVHVVNDHIIYIYINIPCVYI